MDLESENDPSVGVDVLEYIHKHKTGALLEVAVVGGAVMGGGTEEEVTRLRNYAQYIGLAFQVGGWRGQAELLRVAVSCWWSQVACR